MGDGFVGFFVARSKIEGVLNSFREIRVYALLEAGVEMSSQYIFSPGNLLITDPMRSIGLDPDQ